jgi:uncharacterized protein with HEPN domain
MPYRRFNWCDGDHNSKHILGSKDIIGLKNMIVHAYDSIDPTTLRKIIINDFPCSSQRFFIIN